MTDRELLQQSLDALKEADTRDGYRSYSIEIEAISTRLAQPEPEPVAWIYGTGDYAVVRWTKDGSGSEIRTPLYTEPPKKEWVGLTDEEKLIAYSMYEQMGSIGFVQAIEAKLKEKNT